MTDLSAWVPGAPIAAVIALLALRIRALSVSGAIAATIAGTAAVAAGWDWAIYLVAYFIAASALSRYRASEKRSGSSGRIAREGPRDAVQVAANGGVFVIAALVFLAQPGIFAMAAAAAALAASAADTWATEIGSLSRRTPVSIWTLDPVPAGTSGGVTLLGFIATILAGVFSASVALSVGWPGAVAVAALVGAVSGSVFDSVLGATVQARFHCDGCDLDTEQPIHVCGSTTHHVGGWRWLDNDAVNVAATVAGSVDGILAVLLLTR